MAWKNIIVDPKKGDKLDSLSMACRGKIQYHLNKQEVLETLTKSLEKPPDSA